MGNKQRKDAANGERQRDHDREPTEVSTCQGARGGRLGGFQPTVTAVQAAMRQAGIPLQELSTFYEDAADGDENNLLRTCLRWVEVDIR
jgi:hypothetical protein